MTPQCKKDIDDVCAKLAEKHSITGSFFAGLVNAQILVAKMNILGMNAQDKKINIMATMNNFMQDLTFLCFNFGEAYNTIAMKNPAQETPIIPVEKMGELIKEVADELRPLLEKHYGMTNSPMSRH